MSSFFRQILSKTSHLLRKKLRSPTPNFPPCIQKPKKVPDIFSSPFPSFLARRYLPSSPQRRRRQGRKEKIFPSRPRFSSIRGFYLYLANKSRGGGAKKRKGGIGAAAATSSPQKGFLPQKPTKGNLFFSRSEFAFPSFSHK